MPQNSTRSAADEVRAAVAEAIRTNIDYRNVRGLTENPTVTQNPTRQTQEPYIYVYSVGQNEIDSTKDNTPFEYELAIEVVVRYTSYRGGQRQAQELVNEVLQYVRGKNSSEYPDLSAYGFNVYNTTSGDTTYPTDRTRGANYYRAVTPLYVTASWTGTVAQIQPVQSPIFAYNGFAYTPQGISIERYDAGNIVPAQTYPSPNNGWVFDTVSYSLPASAEGVYDGTDYTLTSTNEPVAIDSTINYKRDNGSSTTHVVTTETTFSNDIATTAIEWTIAATTDPFTVYVPQMGDIWSNMNGMFIVEKDTVGGRLFDAVDIGQTVRFTFGDGSASFPVTGKGGRSIIIGDAFDIVGTIGVTFSDGLLYTLEADVIVPVEINTTLAATSSWNRIDSIRYGAIDAQADSQPVFPDDDSPTYGLRLLSNWNVDYGVTDPQNVAVTFTGNDGQYEYIVVNQSVTLAGIRDNLGTNNIANFDVVTDGQYRYYVSKIPILFDNSSFTYTLNT